MASPDAYHSSTYTTLLFLNKQGSKRFHFIKAYDLPAWQMNKSQTEGYVSSDKVTAREWNFMIGSGAKLLERLMDFPAKLEDIAARIFQGVITGADQVFILETVSDREYKSEATGEIYTIEPELMHLLCKGSVNLRRYHVSEITKSILFPYKIVKGNAQLLSTQELDEQFPSAWAYLRENRKILEARERYKWKHEKWYAFGRSQNLAEMEQEKILTPSIAKRSSFTLDTKEYYYFVGSGGGGGGGYGITLNNKYLSLRYHYLIGLLNSRLLDWMLRQTSSIFRGGYYFYNRQYIAPLPIRIIDFSNPSDKTHHDQMIALVECMLNLHKKLEVPKDPQTKNVLKREIETTDLQIDQLVYELYGLTDEETKIVEESMK